MGEFFGNYTALLLTVTRESGETIEKCHPRAHLRLSRERGNPVTLASRAAIFWIPAFAGKTEGFTRREFLKTHKSDAGPHLV